MTVLDSYLVEHGQIAPRDLPSSFSISAGEITAQFTVTKGRLRRVERWTWRAIIPCRSPCRPARARSCRGKRRGRPRRPRGAVEAGSAGAGARGRTVRGRRRLPRRATSFQAPVPFGVAIRLASMSVETWAGRLVLEVPWFAMWPKACPSPDSGDAPPRNICKVSPRTVASSPPMSPIVRRSTAVASQPQASEPWSRPPPATPAPAW